MKLFSVILLAFLATAYGEKDMVEELLPYFAVSQLNADFQKFHLTVPAGCEELNETNFRLHVLGGKCYKYFAIHEKEAIEKCAENEEIKNAMKAWQEKSFEWHKAVQDCMTGEAPPEDDDAWFFLKRKKRCAACGDDDWDKNDDDDDNSDSRTRRDAQRDDSDENHEHHGHHIMGMQECKSKMKELTMQLMEKAAACPAAAKCFGAGDRPSDETDAKWYDYIKTLSGTKQETMKTFRDQFKTCMNQVRKEGLKKYLPGFDVDSFSEDFVEFKPVEDVGCEDSVWGCIQHVHSHAKTCAMTTLEKYGDALATCRNDDATFNTSDLAWQTASFEYHKKIGMCLSSSQDADPPASRRRRAFHRHHDQDDDDDDSNDGDDWDTDTDGDRSHDGGGDRSHDNDDDSNYDDDDDDNYYRKKRSIDSHEGHNGDRSGHGHGQRAYGNPKMCFKMLKKHKQKCNEKVQECPRMAACTGVGDAPEDERLAKWHAYVKGFKDTKEGKVQEHLGKLMACIAANHESSEEAEEEVENTFFFF